MPAIVVALSSDLLFVTSAMIGSVAIYAAQKPSRWEWAVVCVGAVLLAWTNGVPGSPVARVMLLCAYLGMSAFAVTVLAPFLQPSSVPWRLSVARWMLVPPVLLVIVAFSLQAFGRLWAGATVDPQLYAADLSFGLGAVSFTVARWVLGIPVLLLITEVTYINEPLVDVLVFLYLWRRDQVSAWRYFWLLLAVGMTGALLYFLVPAVGTAASLGAVFPWHPPAAIPSGLLPDLALPRSCFPSVHTASGLVLLWACPSGSRARLWAWCYFIPMEIYTLVCGHYVVDLIAAVPFTVALEQVSLRRWRSALIAAAVYALWTGAVLHPWLLTPATAWSLTLTTGAVCWRVRGITAETMARKSPDGGSTQGSRSSGPLAGSQVDPQRGQAIDVVPSSAMTRPPL